MKSTFIFLFNKLLQSKSLNHGCCLTSSGPFTPNLLAGLLCKHYLIALNTNLCNQINRTLEKLYLISNNITSEGIIAISRALETNRTLTVLNLSFNNNSLDSVKALSRVLEVNTVFTALSLESTSITLKGRDMLFHALRVNKTLKELKLLHSNLIGNLLEPVQESIRTNKTLRLLDLNYCSANFVEISQLMEIGRTSGYLKIECEPIVNKRPA
eukprot:TRINITY_DN2619_c0_g4_i2.p1 TRINITY_DN2619_c0_g4~~TRINITY_DN2619_c0_g4_i2.p1  ORF type:complete len:213 (-),score=16.61 TRINITY_DN2619_c0_g4_i2:95-733(-)